MGMLMAVVTALVLFCLIIVTASNQKQINALEKEGEQVKLLQQEPAEQILATPIPESQKQSLPRKLRRKKGAKLAPFAPTALHGKKKKTSPMSGMPPELKAPGPNVRIAVSSGSPVQSADLKAQPKGQYERLLTSDVHTYTGADIPYFNEAIPAFRTRVSSLLATSKKDSIFVSLGSFRDDLCPATLNELFEKAKYPDNVIVGLVDQVKLAEDSDDVACDSSLPEKYRRQVRVVRLTSLEGRGPTHARYIASKLYEGERFYLQIDSHSHFKQNWDENIRLQLSRLPNPVRNVITHYPPGDVAELDDPNPPWICSNRQHPDAPPGLLVQESDWCYPENRSPGVAVAPDGSLTTCVSPFMGGGFIVGPGAWVLDVPYDKYIPYIFHGEELLIAARLWTSGWDMFTPSRSIVDHKYGGRTKNVYAETNTWVEIGVLSTARVRHILGTTLSGDDQIPFDKSELEYLGMGSARSYNDYLEFAGINLKGNSTGRCGQRYDWDQKVWVGRIKLMTG